MWKYYCLINYFKGILRKIIEDSAAGSTVCSLCQLGDKLILEETSKVFKKEKGMKKGMVLAIIIAFHNVILEIIFFNSQEVCPFKSSFW